MSQRKPASGPPSNAPPRDSPSLPSLSPSLSRPHSSHYAAPESPYASRAPAGPPRTTLPPLGSVTSANRLPPFLADTPSSRPLGMYSILNPSHNTQSPLQMEPTTGSGRPPSPAPLAAGVSLPPVVKRPARASPSSEDMTAFGSRAERPILTPKSPVFRATSSGGRRSFAAGPFGISQQSPRMRGESRMFAADPGSTKTSEFPPLPPPTPLGRSSSQFPSLSDPATGQPRRTSFGRNPFAASALQTQGESPSTSHSSYSHFSQSSPILRYGQSGQNPSSLQSGSARQPVSLPPGQSSDNLGDGPYDMSKGSYGISIPTEGGQMLLPVELDVEQASKTANEKRKRNAGASARFRQRRKDKEREAAQTISSLERNLRALEEERNHYRSERDFFRDLYSRQLGPGQMPQRPITPHAPTFSRPSLGDTPPQWQDISRETSEPLPRSVRRRTSSYPAMFPAPPAASPMLPPQAQPYGFNPQPSAPILQPTFPLTRPPPGVSSFPPQAAQSSNSQNPFPPARPPAAPSFSPQQLPPSASSSSSQDPFRRDMYSRSWNPGT